jgi:hypothetical protein
MKMGKGYGCQSMVTRLRRVLVKRPDEHFAVKDYANGIIRIHQTSKRPDVSTTHLLKF